MLWYLMECLASETVTLEVRFNKQITSSVTFPETYNYQNMSAGERKWPDSDEGLAVSFHEAS